jgi:3-keto-5-aminohexanoate cleavage enzyme
MSDPKPDAPAVRFPHPLEPYPPLIINAAVTGVLPSRAQTPHVPLTPDEIVADAVRCCDAGAAIVHVHARDAEHRPTYDPAIFGEIIAGIRAERPELIVCATTSGRRYGEFEQRSAVLELEGDAKPDMASLTTGSLNFPDGPSVNAPDIIMQLAERMRERGIKPELEILELGMINTALILMKKGLAAPPCYFNILLGSAHTAAATMLNVCAAVQSLPPDSVWSLTGLGKFQLKLNTAAILMGGQVRVGIEDNIYYDSARCWKATNVQLVQRVVRLAGMFERAVTTPAQARLALGLPQVPPRDGDGIVIEPAVPSDVPAMLGVLEHANMHRVPCREMPEFDHRLYFVARDGERIVGLCGYRILSETHGKTTLMAVDPDCRGRGLGMRLQAKRLRVMARQGIRTVTTNTDLPATIAWYKKHFGYEEVGSVKKLHEFSDPNVDEWTTLRMDLAAWMARQETPQA